MPKPIKKQEQTTPELASKPPTPDAGLANNVIPGEIANALTPTPEPLQEAPPQPSEASITAPVEVKEPEPSLDALKAEKAALQAKLAAQPVPTAKVATSTLPATDKEGRKLAWATGIPTITKTASPQ